MVTMACGLRAQGPAITANVPVLDPANFVLFPLQPLSTFNNPRTYMVNIPYGMNFLVLSISPTTNADTIFVGLSCTADSSGTYLAANPNGSPPQQFFVQSKNVAGVTVTGGGVINLAAGFPTTVTTSVIGCGQLAVLIQTPTGTITDTARAQGIMGSAPVVPFGAGGIPSTIALVTDIVTGKISPLSTFNGAIVTTPSGTNVVDVCQFPGIAKNFINISITTAGTVQIVPLSAGKSIFVCGYNLASNSTVATNTISFVQGTGTNCGTGQNIMTGPMQNGIEAVSFSYSGPGTIIATVNSQALCITTTVGTTPSIAGVVTYVQF